MVIDRGFVGDIDWQQSVTLDGLTEQGFLCETAFVILNSGMRATVVRTVWPEISWAFLQWRSARAIVEHRTACTDSALKVFKHRPKIEAIAKVAEIVDRLGFDAVKHGIARDGIAFLRQFPFIGPVTCYHLGKNIGLPVVKPDRHLVRMADAAGYVTPHAMCQVIADSVGDSLPVVDMVLWRFATLEPAYVGCFLNGATA